ncbi:uncharacterized protein LOC132712963 [Ruditapes philippinarum]|uniref:uncharacterized protein LOC132712963 n=1 Tax=Ruditapes philippinarum TaxID=129788 RepID=UPI00295A92E7|nr:uncharacterized protein LOC132712963 [Ruditapes philippinarum]
MTSFLTDISSCDQKHCKEKSHERHHLFNENYANEIRRKHYYGIKYFKTKTVEQLHEQLQNQFMYQMLDPKYPATGLRIQMIRSVQTNSCLYKLFCRNQIISHSYLAYLLLKEALAFIVATYKTISYTEADKSCSETEKDIRDIIPKLKKN